MLDNKGYGTERLLQAGHHRYNEVHPWQYHKLPEVFGGGTGYEVRTEGEFDAAPWSALADSGRSEPDSGPPRPQRLQHRPAPPGQPPRAEVGWVSSVTRLATS